MAKHVTMEERDQIADLVRRGLKPTQIALRLNRHHSVIARELKRNQADDGQYYAAAAHQKAITRRRERPLVRNEKWIGLKSSVLSRADFITTGLPTRSAVDFDNSFRKIWHDVFPQRRSTHGSGRTHIEPCGKAT